MAMNTVKGTQAFQDTIAQYLMARAENDPLVAVKARKSLQDDGAVLRLYHWRGQEKRMLRFYRR